MISLPHVLQAKQKAIENSEDNQGTHHSCTKYSPTPIINGYKSKPLCLYEIFSSIRLICPEKEVKSLAGGTRLINTSLYQGFLADLQGVD